MSRCGQCLLIISHFGKGQLGLGGRGHRSTEWKARLDYESSCYFLYVTGHYMSPTPPHTEPGHLCLIEANLSERHPGLQTPKEESVSHWLQAAHPKSARLETEPLLYQKKQVVLR